MGSYKVLSQFLCLSLTLPLFSSMAQADPATDSEALDNMQVEDEVLHTSTDDIEAQKKEALEQARIAEGDRRIAQERLTNTRARRRQVEVESRIEIDREMTLRNRSIKARKMLEAQIYKLEKEIAVMEQKVSSATNATNKAQRAALDRKQNYEQLRSKKARLATAQKRSITSYTRNDENLPQVLPPKRRQ